MAANTKEIYGSMVFNEHVMKERLPSATYKSLKATIDEGKPLDLDVANVVASVMKDWALERAPPIIPTGSSPSPASPPRSTTALYLP